MTSHRSPGDLETRIAAGVARLVSNGTGPAPTGAADDASFERLQRRLARRDRRLGQTRVTLLLTAALMVGASSYWAFAYWSGRTGDVITYRVGSGPSLAAGAPEIGGDASAATGVTFSDGTRIQLEPRTRGRVLDLDRRGGRVALYDGKAQVDVRHRPNARWLFQAGPFEVRVHGTSFSIAWNPAATRFELRMQSGEVSVVGPISGGEMTLRAGEKLSVSLGSREVHAVAALDGADATTPEPAAHGAGEAATPAVGLAERRREPGGLGRESGRLSVDWRAELADGRASDVVADARHRGFDRVIESASSEDLAALADAARYVGNEDLARRVLLAERRRFPRSGRAAEASFLLGRLEDESALGDRRALAWYDRYLAEAPAGAYVAEALGRKMMVLERAHRRDEAVAIAADYLRRFPAGSYAHAADALVGASRPATPRAP